MCLQNWLTKSVIQVMKSESQHFPNVVCALGALFYIMLNQPLRPSFQGQLLLN